jgi:predicted Zn-dependent peptidase
MLRIRVLMVTAIICLAGVVQTLEAQDLASIEKNVTLRTLPNGLTVLLYERHEAPVFSFYTLVDAGSAQDPKGESGLAHMFEHMAFKGTPQIGTTNFEAEKKVLEKIEQIYAQYIYERDRQVGRDPQKVAELEKSWKTAATEAEQYVVRNEFGRIVEENGGVGLNAGTSADQTVYYYSLPVNRLELWAYLESSRFLQPVMREFYKERDVVQEERRMRVDSQPTSRMIEQFTGTAFLASPYGTPGVGWPDDLKTFSATDAMRFFDRYYVPSNMVIAVVGDLNPAEAMPVIEKYFGRLPTRPKPDTRVTSSPPQNSVRQVVVNDRSQPFYIEGYQRPDYSHPDDAIYDAISDILSNGRVSRMYRSLVVEKQTAAAAAGFSGMPGTKYPHLFAFYAVPTPGHTPEDMAKAIHEEIEKLKTSEVTDGELARFKTRSKADLIRSLGSNSGMASQLAVYQARFGDWREIFHQLDRYDKITKQDIIRVAKSTFTASNRTVAMLQTIPAAGAAAAPKEGAPAKQPGKAGSRTAKPTAGGQR